MRFNSENLVEFAVSAGDHEGRLTYKPPPKTLYDSAYKERWFKLKANFLFYYRLNEYGAVDRNEPSGVFVLENIDIKREDVVEAPFGFAIQWKDDPERKHLFLAQSEASVLTWISKLIYASYGHLREQLYNMRSQIKIRTGEDPLEGLDMPLPQPHLNSGHQLSKTSQFHVSLEQLHVSDSSLRPAMSAPATPITPRALTSPVTHHNSYMAKSQSFKLGMSKSPSQRRKEPVRSAPVPPPRKNKKQNPETEKMKVEELVPGVGGVEASFKCHLSDACPPTHPSSAIPNLLD